MIQKLVIVTALVLCIGIKFADGQIKNSAGVVKGRVCDAASGEPVVGATLYFPSLNKGVSADLEGYYTIKDIPLGVHEFKASCIGYTTVVISDLEVTEGIVKFDLLMEESVGFLEEAVVTSVKRMNSRLAMIQSVKTANVVVSGVSGIEISKSQDRDASEVIRRIPGVSVINDRHIIVRGLPARYNNVWINNSSVPSTEADSRSFSFDLIPASQLESIMIVKSQSSEIPADFSGGFVKINTGSMPEENSTSVSVGSGINSETHFSDFYIGKSYSSDFIGFDDGTRALAGFVPSRVDNNNRELVDRVTKEGLNNDWFAGSESPLPDIKLSVMHNRAFELKDKSDMGITAALNYSNSYSSQIDMENSRFGAYNMVQDKPEYFYNYTDNQFNKNTRLGGMLNLTWMDEKNKLEFRNMVNVLGKNRYTVREGWQNMSALYNQEKYEYLYTSRYTLTSQLAGRHELEDGNFNWNISYSFAGMNQPDRRIINLEENRIVGDLYYGMMGIDQNEITRDFVKLDENIGGVSLNYTRRINSASIEGEIKTGLFGEMRKREYNNRQFFYRFNRYNLSQDFVYGNPVDDILAVENYGADKLYLYEDTDNRNSYKGDMYNSAAYLSANLTSGRFTLLAGARVEAGRMKLTSYEQIYEFTTSSKNYDIVELYPSLNLSYDICDKNLLRFAYGKSINKQEFRELSSSVYYDFNLFSDVKGNPDLKHALIHNLDLRYEYYPTPSEYASFAIFYKHFRNPIEWTYLDAGGSYTFTFENAESADNWGVEADIKKNLDFIGLDDFTLALNAAWIYSRVEFDRSRSLEKERAMQGQSPYLINSSLHYDNKQAGLNISLLYNRIGRRIVGIGRADTGSGASINNDVPDTYELPRDLIDLSVSKSLGDRVVLKFRASDILGQDVIFEQYPKFVDQEGVVRERTQVSKRFSPGRGFSLSLQMNF